jgi:hypothetical protein
VENERLLGRFLKRCSRLSLLYGLALSFFCYTFILSRLPRCSLACCISRCMFVPVVLGALKVYTRNASTTVHEKGYVRY